LLQEQAMGCEQEGGQREPQVYCLIKQRGNPFP